MVVKLSTELRTEICLLHSQHSVRRTAEIFNQNHPERPVPVAIATVSKIWRKFKETGSVHDRKRSGRPPVPDETSIAILAKIAYDPHLNVRSLGREAGISFRSVWKILKKNKFHPYKMKILHKLEPGDYQSRLDFCNQYLQTIDNSPEFPCKVLWTDESTFTLKGWMNKQNYR